MIGVNDINTANIAKRKCRRIVLVAYDGVQGLDIMGPSSVFARANEFAPNSYVVVHASPQGGQVTTDSGLVISNLTPTHVITEHLDTILVCGGSEMALRKVIFEDNLPEWLCKMAPKVRRLGSVCTGAFVLAASGFLDNRRAVTHWASCDILKTMRPSIEVEPNAIFIRDGQFFTSAGVTAAIDAALLLVQEDLGRPIAAKIAKSMVLFLHRSGGQSQYSNALAAQSSATSKFSELINWISDNLTEELSIATLAEQSGMSQRTFLRRFQQEVGDTPAVYVRTVRLEAACYWLESTNWPIKRVAQLSGFGSSDSLERAIKKKFDTTCSGLRNGFGEISQDYQL